MTFLSSAVSVGSDHGAETLLHREEPDLADRKSQEVHFRVHTHRAAPTGGWVR